MKKQKQKSVNLSIYHPDINESLMLINSFEKSIQKILTLKNSQNGIILSASKAKNLIDSVFLFITTYNDSILINSITKIIEWNKEQPQNEDMTSRLIDIRTSLDNLDKSLTTIANSITLWFRCIPLHLRLGTIVTKTNPKTIKGELLHIQKGISKSIELIDEELTSK